MADVSVRPARQDDVAEIARIQVETWRASYLAILPASVIESLSVELAQQAWQQAVAAPPTPRHHVLVAQEQQAVVGFVAFGPADDLEPADPDPEATAALGPLLVEPRWGRRGHGSRLLAAAVDLARVDAMARAIAWIPEGDVVSRAFLESAGWAPDGLARALDTGAGELREIRLHASLAEAAA
ncbi:MAG: N-acetyltransferase [Pseudonocardiales bacterium]|nr:MAG: N-acetyltransferase [Pseudonocardiales bacterium]